MAKHAYWPHNRNMAGSISWQEFEALVARLQRTFNKTATVTHNEKLKGRESGRARQIDICIRATIGTENVLMIVECKKLTRKVDLEAVEAFAEKKNDVGAQVGIMVSTAGFSKAAYQKAAVKNISLYKYKDTLRDNWPSGLETNVLLEVWELTPTKASFVLVDGTEEQITTDVGLEFIDNRGPQIGGLASLLQKFWQKATTEERSLETWMYDFPLRAPERPEIKNLRLGAQSKFVRGLRKGRIHFEGLVNESEGYANVVGWTMVFDGGMTPWPKEKPLPLTQSLSILIKSVFIKTSDPKSQEIQGLIYNGVMVVDLTGNNVMKLPIKPI